jgi:putative pyruvate formate lyase activating enzyme
MANAQQFLVQHLSECRLCPRNCKVNRAEGEIGKCGVGREILISSISKHFGEEPPLVGTGGSGTIFFSGCNLKCVFCQNYEISQGIEGFPTSEEELAQMMLQLQTAGAHNVNLVSPTHFGAQILVALKIAKGLGLSIPVVYNSGGYDSVKTLKFFDGYVDIYMPDAKYADAAAAKKYSGVSNYPQRMKSAIKEMHRQVGDLVIENGVAVSGLIVRHLVLPKGIAGSREIIDFVADKVSSNTYFNLMRQYRPCYRAGEFPELQRYVGPAEYVELYTYAKEKGLRLAR